MAFDLERERERENKISMRREQNLQCTGASCGECEKEVDVVLDW